MSTRDRRTSLVLLMLAVLDVVLCSAILPAKPALAAAGVPSAAAPSAPLQAPLDPAFIRYEAQFPLGTPQWVATGLGFGLLPDPVDLSYARGLTRTRAFDHAYPASFDLRTAGKLTSVKNQNPTAPAGRSPRSGRSRAASCRARTSTSPKTTWLSPAASTPG